MPDTRVPWTASIRVLSCRRAARPIGWPPATLTCAARLADQAHFAGITRERAPDTVRCAAMFAVGVDGFVFASFAGLLLAYSPQRCLMFAGWRRAILSSMLWKFSQPVVVVDGFVGEADDSGMSSTPCFEDVVEF